MLGLFLALAGGAVLPAQVRVDFNARRVTHVSESGFADRADGRAATADDAVRIASISKLVTALGVMRLVEGGTLDLDADVSRYLGWSFRNPRFPDVPITLRLLLSHRSSLRDDVDYVIPLGTSLRTVVADPRAWDSTHPPGRWFRYTNLNFPVVATAMESVTGMRFDALMAKTVFTPLKIDACFNWTTCSDAKVARGVVLYGADGNARRDDLQGKRPDCPVLAPARCDLSGYLPGTNGALFSPQGGVRISMRDLARIGQLLMRRGEGFLKPASIATLITPAWRYDGSNGDTSAGFYCTYALAVQTLATAQAGCGDDPFADSRPRFGHAGEAYGLRSGLWIDPKTRKGMAFFVTAVPDDGTKGRSSFTAAEEAMMTAK